MSDNPKISQADLARLRSEIENHIGRRISTPADFDFLSDRIRTATNEYVSTSTLMRIWGYMHDTGRSYSPSFFTLRILSNFIGYRDIRDFVKKKEIEAQSKIYSGKFIESSRLPANAIITLKWHPNRVCTLRHIADTLFEVTYSLNGRLQIGDHVECGGFTENAPVYFSRIYRNGVQDLTYVAGMATGVTIDID
ncbi:MAG: hypothetical protein K2H61_05850 [Muribaculaceae bacterium]|nr:hypothetical protein [Muribaculaceae bacterium]MDE7394368.1 hypothetical protein [Muribaculaceae bacterium]